MSYAHVDFAYVRRLVAWLRQRGVDGWVDDEIDRGARWSEVLRERIESCAVLVLVMSPAAAESEYVRREVDLARALGKRIKPLLLEGGVIFDLGAVQYEDVRDGRMPGEVFVAGLPRRHTTVVREPRPRVQHLVGSVPHRADCFQERALLAQVRAATTGGGTAIVTQVLTGLGGVGKTQLAAAVAHELIDGANLDALVWVTARSRDDMVTTYARAGHEIRGADDSDPEAAAAIFLEWLGTTTGQWLVVLDDVADPADLTGLWPPQSLSGRVVVTTRRRDAALASHGRLIPVGVFSPRRGVHLFGGEARRPARAAGRGRRARLDVGYLPLMLGQAAAYIADQDITCAEYRRRFAHAKTLVDVVPEPAAIPDDYRVPVAAALLLSVDVADALRPAGLASPLLALLSLLDPNGIPLHIVTTGASVAYLNAHRSAGADGEPVAAQQARDAVMCLARLNLVDVEREGSDRERIRVHSLVQRAARDPAPPELIAAAAVAAGDCLVDIWPDVERDSGLVQQLRSNTDALRAYAEDQLWQPDAHPVLFRSGQSLGEAGLVGAAVDHFARLVAEATARLGRDHPDTLATRGSLARWRGGAGDAAGAAAEFEALVADRLRVLGPDHPDTLAARGNLAAWRGEAGDAAGAVAAFEALLADQLRVLGPDHPDTLTTRSWLAYLWGEANGSTGTMPTEAATRAEGKRPVRLSWWRALWHTKR